MVIRNTANLLGHLSLLCCCRLIYLCVCVFEREREETVVKLALGLGHLRLSSGANTGAVTGRARTCQTVPRTAYGFRAHSNLRKTQTSGSVCVLKRNTHTHTHSVIGEKETDTSEDCRQINLNISISGRTNKNSMKINLFWLTILCIIQITMKFVWGHPPKMRLLSNYYYFVLE